MSDESSTPEAAPVRVPNVSAGARSGLDHVVIGSNAQAAHEANLDLQQQDPDKPTGPPEQPVEVPPDDVTTVDDLLGWVDDAEGDERRRRAELVLGLENAKEQPRTTLVAALEDTLGE